MGGGWMWGGKAGVRQFVMKQQKGMETQMLLEVWMIKIFKSSPWRSTYGGQH